MKFRVAVFHWSFRKVGGGERLAWYLGKALNCKVYSFKKSVLGFEDLTPYIPWLYRAFVKVRSLDYLVWSMLDITEIGDFDIIITSGSTARAIITPEYVMHVHYCHSPPRWLYDLWNWNRRKIKLPIKKLLVNIIGEIFRIWDSAVDTRVDYYFTNSEIVKRRLWKYLKRDSVVLYPPIECNKYKYNEPEDFVLFLSRLEPEKRVEEAIQACIKAGQKIVVAGTGTLEKRIRDKYENHPLVEIKGFVDDEEKIELLSRCKALIFPAVAEDFGIVPVEALASGKPVITNNTGFSPILLKKTGYRCKNGVLEVYEGGIVVKNDDIIFLKRAVEYVDKYEWNPEYLRSFSKRFDFSIFKYQLKYQLEAWKKEFDERIEEGLKHGL